MKFILIGIVGLIALGYFFMPKQKNVSKKLEKARQLLKDGEVIKLNQMLDEIIVFPISEKYSAEYAQQLIEALMFLKEVCKAQNISKDNLIDPVLNELKKIQIEGGKIDSDYTDPLEKWIDQMSKDTEGQARQLMKDASNGEAEVIAFEGEEDFTSEITSEESQVVNKVGSYLLKRKFDEGVQFIDSHLPESMSAFKATLLDQKAALYFMDGKIKEAVEHYLEILTHYPDNNRIKTSVAEGYVELGEHEKAVQYAKEVVANSKDKDSYKTCQKIIKKLG